MLYYAKFDVTCSDIAVFKTKEERDKWVKKADFFDRVPLSEEEAEFYTDIHSFPVDDPIDGNVRWLLCYINH